jgi:mono/diheme cytochrome c family protein
MSRLLAAATCAAVLAGALPARAQAPAAGDAAPADAGELFQSRCAACHVAPDQRFETDRAWIEQVRDTA